MDDVLDALGAQQDELTALLTALDSGDWARVVPACPGWDVADVVLHVAQTNEMAIASAEGRLPAWYEEQLAGAPVAGDVDDGAAILVAAQRGRPTAELLERWRTGADALRALLATGDPHDRVEWVAGTLSLHTLATTRLAETWIHTTDVAGALGVALAPTARLRHIARLAWRTLPYAFGRAGRALAGPVAFELVGPDSDAWTFAPDEPAATVVRGSAAELCGVAARRLDPASTSLAATGPDASAVLELVRTYA